MEILCMGALLPVVLTVARKGLVKRLAQTLLNILIQRSGHGEGCSWHLENRALSLELTLQLSFCFEVRTLSDRLVSSVPE
jgi:hypothetical protein